MRVFVFATIPVQNCSEFVFLAGWVVVQVACSAASAVGMLLLLCSARTF